MRLTAVWRSLNFLTGVAPGRLFQISIRRVAGHSAAGLAFEEQCQQFFAGARSRSDIMRLARQRALERKASAQVAT